MLALLVESGVVYCLVWVRSQNASGCAVSSSLIAHSSDTQLLVLAYHICDAVSSPEGPFWRVISYLHEAALAPAIVRLLLLPPPSLRLRTDAMLTLTYDVGDLPDAHRRPRRAQQVAARQGHPGPEHPPQRAQRLAHAPHLDRAHEPLLDRALRHPVAPRGRVGVVCAVVPRALGAVARDARGLGGAGHVVGGVGVRYGGVSGEEGEPRVDELEAVGSDTGGTEAVISSSFFSYLSLRRVSVLQLNLCRHRQVTTTVRKDELCMSERCGSAYPFSATGGYARSRS